MKLNPSGKFLTRYTVLSPLEVFSTGISNAGLGGSVGCAVRLGRGRQHSFVEVDHEIFSTVILSLPLIHEGQLSVSGERMYTILVSR